MAISSYEEVLNRNARWSWFDTTQEAIDIGNFTPLTVEGIKETMVRVEEVLLRRFCSVDTISSTISDIELEIYLLQKQLIDINLSHAYMSSSEDDFEHDHSTPALPTCIENIETWALELDSPLMYRAFKQAESLYHQVMREKQSLRHQVIRLSESKRRLEDRLRQYLDSLGASNDYY